MTPYIVLILVLVFFSAFFSSTEIAYTSVNKMRLEKLADEGKKSAKLALYISNHYERALSGILIGNNLVNIAASSVMTLIVLLWLGEDNSASGLISTAIITVIILIFGEIAPKCYAKQNALSYACATSYPFFIICMVIFMPVTLIVMGIVGTLSPLWKKHSEEPTVTEDELATMIETAEEEAVLDEDRSELLQSALDFSDTTVEDILVPRINLDAVDIDDGFDAVMNLAVSTRFSRLILYRGTIDHIVGILYLNRFFKAVAENGDKKTDIASLLIEPCFVHKTLKLPAALATMRKAKAQMVVVLDEYGGTMGIVTMEDILEEIVGDIYDESDDIENEIVKTGEDSYDVDGATNIYDFFEYIDFDDHDFESEYTTMGGWAIEMREADPHIGDSFTYRNLYVIITEMNDNIVTKLSIQVKPIEKENDKEE